MPIAPAAFAEAWIAAWNARDLESVLGHYARDVVFLSPYAEQVIGTGRVVGIDALRAYWQRGLAANPDLRFDLDCVLTGHDGLTILYRNHRAQRVTETLEFDHDDKVISSMACYAAT